MLFVQCFCGENEILLMSYLFLINYNSIIASAANFLCKLQQLPDSKLVILDKLENETMK